MVITWSLISLLIIAKSTNGFQFRLTNECKSVTNHTVKLDDKIKFHDMYKVSAVISNLEHNQTIMVTEATVADRRVTKMKSRKDKNIQWITQISNSKTFCFNQTDYSCSLSSNNSYPFKFPSGFGKILGNGSSLSSIASSVLMFSKENNGSLVDNSVVSGVEGILWISCINGSDNNKVQVEVVYTAENSFKPASVAFDNPLLLFVRVTEYNSSVPLSSYAIEFNTYDEVTEEDEHLFTTPTGTVCDDWDTTELPLNISDPFSSVIEYSDIESNWTKREIMIWHSTSDKLAYVYEPKINDTLFFFNEKSISKGADVVVHDFATGYEYSLSKSRCVHLSPLSGNTSDVKSVNGALSLRSVSDILMRDLHFGRYTYISSEDGRNLDVFRAKDTTSGYTVEARIENGHLHSILHFTKKTTGEPQLVSSTFFMSSPQISPAFYMERIRACFAQSSDPVNKTYTFDVKSKFIADVYTVGTEVLSSALSTALRQLAPINPFRISISFESNSSGNLGAFITIAEKSNVQPANVGYNYTEEVSTAEFFLKLNDTITKGDWKFPVPTPDHVEEWTVAANSLSCYTVPSLPRPYVGYSGGSMFVLGLFSIILGTAIGAGGVFFISKRQRISTLAYQVFE